jgi:stringent starvation protein B
MQDMTSNQPYLVKAFFDWIIDNDLTPYMVIDANAKGAELPQQFVKDGQIVLNLSPAACVKFHMDLDWISFQARFSGQPMKVSFPIKAVSAIYAKENGAGTVFTSESLEDDLEPPEPPPPSPPKVKKATLRVVK